MPKPFAQTDENKFRVSSRKLVPLLIIAGCLIAYYFSTQFERVPPILKRGMQPADFPQLILGLLIGLSIVLLLFDKAKTPKKLPRQVLILIMLLGGFVLLAELDLFLGLGIFSATLSFAWGERRIKMLALIGIVMPFAVFFLFDTVFEVRFPRGLLTNIWYG